MSIRPSGRMALWMVVAALIYLSGRWHERILTHRAAASAATPSPTETGQRPASRSAPAASDPGAPQKERLFHANAKVAEVDALAAAACLMSEPDARTYAFFENLDAADLAPVAAYIEGMPSGNEQDVMFVMLMRRWAQLDGPGAIARAEAFPVLSTRTNARLAAYEEWADGDATGALAAAQREPQENTRMLALASVFRGAARSDPRTALHLLQAMPEDFHDSQAAEMVIRQLVNAAYGTGKRSALCSLIQEMPAGGRRNVMTAALAREWGGHHPDEAIAWILQSAPPGEEREAAVGTLFRALARKDPSMAAACAVAYPDAGRQPSLIADAVSEWARWDVAGAESWLREQPTGRHLDRASCVMAGHFMLTGDMSRALGWIRRIDQGEMQKTMLTNLGRAWTRQRPDELRQLIASGVLNASEAELLSGRAGPSS